MNYSLSGVNAQPHGQSLDVTCTRHHQITGKDSAASLLSNFPEQSQMYKGMLTQLFSQTYSTPALQGFKRTAINFRVKILLALILNKSTWLFPQYLLFGTQKIKPNSLSWDSSWIFILSQGISQNNYGETYVDCNKVVTYVHYLFWRLTVYHIAVFKAWDHFRFNTHPLTPLSLL